MVAIAGSGEVVDVDSAGDSKVTGLGTGGKKRRATRAPSPLTRVQISCSALRLQRERQLDGRFKLARKNIQSLEADR